MQIQISTFTEKIVDCNLVPYPLMATNEWLPSLDGHMPCTSLDLYLSLFFLKKLAFLLIYVAGPAPCRHLSVRSLIYPGAPALLNVSNLIWSFYLCQLLILKRGRQSEKFVQAQESLVRNTYLCFHLLEDERSHKKHSMRIS